MNKLTKTLGTFAMVAYLGLTGCGKHNNPASSNNSNI